MNHTLKSSLLTLTLSCSAIIGGCESDESASERDQIAERLEELGYDDTSVRVTETYVAVDDVLFRKDALLHGDYAKSAGAGSPENKGYKLTLVDSTKGREHQDSL